MTTNETIDGLQEIINRNQKVILPRVHIGYLIHAVKYLKEQKEEIENLKQTAQNMAQNMMEGTRLLKEQEAKPPVHIHEEYPEHDWERDKNGDIDYLAYDGDYHNGPACARCNYAFCIHCDPDGWNKEPCIIDEYKCPKCGKYITKRTKFCSDCGQAVKWE